MQNIINYITHGNLYFIGTIFTLNAELKDFLLPSVYCVLNPLSVSRVYCIGIKLKLKYIKVISYYSCFFSLAVSYARLP